MWGSRPFVAGEPGCRRQVLAFRVEFKGALVGSIATVDGPLGGIKNNHIIYHWLTQLMVGAIRFLV